MLKRYTSPSTAAMTTVVFADLVGSTGRHGGFSLFWF